MFLDKAAQNRPDSCSGVLTGLSALRVLPRSPFSAVVGDRLGSGSEPAPVCSHPLQELPSDQIKLPPRPRNLCDRGRLPPRGPFRSARCSRRQHGAPCDTDAPALDPASVGQPLPAAGPQQSPLSGNPLRSCSPGLAAPPHASGLARRLPSSGPFSRPLIHAAGARASLPDTTLLDCPRELVFGGLSPRAPPPSGLCPFQSSSPLSLHILGHCLALSRCSKKAIFKFKWVY